jgi:hypothetical protein
MIILPPRFDDIRTPRTAQQTAPPHSLTDPWMLILYPIFVQLVQLVLLVFSICAVAIKAFTGFGKG